MKLTRGQFAALLFSLLYLVAGGLYFVRNLNLEFVIYVLVIIVILGLLFATLRYSKLPTYVVWMLCIWGLMHVLGGAMHTQDGVLFAYRIYPFIDRGGDFYVLKYDQVVHAYLYGVVTVTFWYLLRQKLGTRNSTWLVLLIAAMASMGVSAMNEIMEFLISITLERNGVGGYENTLLDLISNFTGSVLAVLVLLFASRRLRRPEGLP